MSNETVTREDLVQEGLREILAAFGKGQDLRGAVSYIVNCSVQWAYERGEIEGRKKEREKNQ